MAYQSLYRKYRPQTFADVVGQGHVVRTLQNAITSGRIAHGYLFTGTRGTAKTTIARLLAKALNCRSEQGPVAEPCNLCDACKAITAGGHVDVVEMDAASHRGVADIEEVRKNVGYGPMELRYKVFIIDEAHQLSSDAKDAFLKTLEEPPPGVVFILATTEPQAIPITIRSRCQQFDFKRGSLTEISGRLKYVLSAEGVGFTDEAVALVARGAEGSYRDSLSLLEQVLAFSPDSIDAEAVQTVLGTLDKETLAAVVTTVTRKDAPGAFALAGQILDSGKEARTLIKTLAAHFRDLLLVRVGGPAVAAELTPEDVKALQPQAASFDPAQLLKAIEILNEAFSETRWNNQHRLLTELTFLKLMNLGEGSAAPLATAPIVFNTAPVPVQAPVQPPVTVAKPAPAPSVAMPAPSSPPPSGTPGYPSRVTAGEVDLLSEDSGGGKLDASYFADEEGEADSEIEMEASDDEGIEVEPEVIAPAELELEDELPPPPTEPELEYNDGMALFGGDEADLFTGAVSGGADPEPASKSEPKVVASPVVELVRMAEPTIVLEEDQEPPAPTEPDIPTPSTATPKNVAEAEPFPYSIEDIQQYWPEFLRRAEQASKGVQVQMSNAFPSELEGRVIVFKFKAASSYEMMNQQRQMNFVRTLLGKILKLERVEIRFEKNFDETMEMKFDRGVERPKIRHDRLAEAIKSFDSDADEVTPPAFQKINPPLENVHRSYERNENFAQRPQPASLAPTTPAPNPWAVRHDEPGRGPKEDPAVKARKEQALAEPLVQDALEVFGGEIIVD